jgi:porin
MDRLPWILARLLSWRASLEAHGGAMRTAYREYNILFKAAGAAVVLAGALVNPLHAQQAGSAISYDGPLLDRSTLTGNWGGARDDLAARGITITPSVTQFGQGPTSGNTDEQFEYGGKAEAFLNIDFAKLGLWNGFAMQVHGEYNFGKTPGATVGGTTIPNNTAMTFPYENQPGGDLTSVYFSQRFGSDFTLLVGKINIFDLYSRGTKFNGGRGIESFWNTAFVGPPSGIVPVAMFGAIGILKINPLTFTLMVYDPKDALNYTGFEDPFSTGLSLRGTVELSSNLFGLPRKDGITVAVSSEEGTDFTTLPDLGKFPNTPEFRASLINALITRALWGQDGWIYLPPQLLSSSSPPSEKRGRYWVGYSFEQTLWQSAANPTKAWGLFGQVAFSDGNPNAWKWSAMGGIGGTSPLPGRPNDKFGVGAFYYGYADELKQHLDPLITLGDEYGAELFYNFAITKWFKITADLQVIAPAIRSELIAPKTTENNPTVVLLGLRGQLTF